MSQEQSNRLAGNLKKLLKERNLTMSAVCRRIGMNKSTLHNYCNGVVPRNLVKLQELADLLGVSMNDLVMGDRPSTEQAILSQEERYEVTIKRIQR